MRTIREYGCREFLRFLTIFLLSSCPIFGQQELLKKPGGTHQSLNPTLFMDQYHPRTWWREDGLPSNQLTDLAQSPNGYLWIGTSRGLARFDGVRFTVFDRSNTPQLLSDRITALLGTPEGTLWIGTEHGGLLRCDTTRASFERIEGIEHRIIRTLYRDRKGTLWVGTKDETWKVIKDKPSIVAKAPNSVLAICEDKDGVLWFGSSLWHKSNESRLHSFSQVEPGLYRYQNASFHRMTKADGFPKIYPDNSVTALCSDQNGDLWIGTAGPSLLRYKDGVFEDYAKVNKMQVRHVHKIVEDRRGTLWVAVSSSHLWRISEGKPIRTSTGWLDCLMEDDDGGLWLGFTHNRGLRRLRNADLIRASHHLGFPNLPMNCLGMDSQGAVWIGTPMYGLSWVDNGKIEHILRDDGKRLQQVTSLHIGKDESVWVATWQGLYRYKQDNLTQYQTSDGLSSQFVRLLFQDSTEVLWIGFVGNGLQRMNGKSFNTVSELDHVEVNWVYEENPHRYWIGTNGGLFQWEHGEVKQMEDAIFQRLPDLNFTCHYADSEGNLWLGTRGGGLLQHRDGHFRIWTRKEGLHDDTIYVIQEDKEKHLWLCGEHGFERVSKSALLTRASGKQVRSRAYSVGERQWTARIMGNGFKKSSVAPDGSLWFATEIGIVILPPEGPQKNQTVPSVLIEEVTGDGTKLVVNTPFEVQPGTHRLEFRFTSPSFFSPKMIHFKYRLIGYDEDWVDSGSQRWTFYNDLPPGEYEFQVIADNGDAVWNEEGAKVQFIIHQLWWKTGWFFTLSFLGLMTVLCFLVRARQKAINNRNEQNRRHREELARVARVATMGELTATIAHEVNQPLCAIVSNAQAATRFLNRENADLDEATAALQDICDDGNRASKVIARVRALAEKRGSKLEPLNLNQLTREVMALFQLDTSAVQVELQLSNELPITQGDPIELQQVVLNLLVNAAQSVQRARVTPKIVVGTSVEEGNMIQFSISDNGTGLEDEQLEQLFDPLYTTKLKGIGMGLAICRRIIESHKGKLWVSKNIDRGVTFHFTLPISERL